MKWTKSRSMEQPEIQDTESSSVYNYVRKNIKELVGQRDQRVYTGDNEIKKTADGVVQHGSDCAAEGVADEIGEGSGREIHRTTPSFIALRSAGASVRKRLASAHPFLPFCF